jgi:hypothetical protein
MVAHADDLRYFYSAFLGRTEELAITDAGVTEVAEALEPGRYLVHILDATGRIYVQQGLFGSNAPAAAAPAFPMDNDGIRAIEIVVRPRLSGNSIAARATGGVTATLVVTKISSGRA